MKYHKTDWQCCQAAYKRSKALWIAQQVVQSRISSGAGSVVDCEHKANNYQVISISTVKLVANPFKR